MINGKHRDPGYGQDWRLTRGWRADKSQLAKEIATLELADTLLGVLVCFHDMTLARRDNVEGGALGELANNVLATFVAFVIGNVGNLGDVVVVQRAQKRYLSQEGRAEVVFVLSILLTECHLR